VRAALFLAFYLPGRPMSASLPDRPERVAFAFRFFTLLGRDGAGPLRRSQPRLVFLFLDTSFRASTARGGCARKKVASQFSPFFPRTTDIRALFFQGCGVGAFMWFVEKPPVPFLLPW